MLTVTARPCRGLGGRSTPTLQVDTGRKQRLDSCRMSTRTQPKARVALLQGTLDRLILRTLVFGAPHGQGIARAIEQQSEDALLVDHGSLYPALQRLEERGWIAAEWGTSDNNRKARFYELTRKGRQPLVAETDTWRELTAAIGRILGPQET
jgi:PadR family transcriptional regulator, regulatory protein PadR